MRKKENREPTRLRSLRMPERLFDKATAEASRQGTTFNTFVVNAVRKALGEDDGSVQLLDAVAKWLKAKYLPRKDFPLNVTLEVFHHIRDDRRLRKLYDSIVLDRHGDRNYDALVPLHKNIGLLVKTLLNAQVVGRSLPLEPEENLIKTYSLLKKQ